MRKRTSGIDRALNDIKKGSVFHAKDSADIIKQIFGKRMIIVTGTHF